MKGIILAGAYKTRLYPIIEGMRKTIISCPEQIAFKQGWISADDLAERAELLKKNEYGNYLKKTLDKYKHNKH